MIERALWPGNVAAAAILIGGVLIAALPSHAASIAQIVIATAAVSAGLYALAVHVPPTGWLSPFTWMAPFHHGLGGGRRRWRSDDLGRIRSRLSGRRQRVETGPPLPPGTLRLLKPLIAVTLDLELRGDAPPSVIRDRVSPLTWSVLTTDPEDQAWFRMRPPNPSEVAEAVHEVLDDLDRLQGRRPSPLRSMTPAAEE